MNKVASATARVGSLTLQEFSKALSATCRPTASKDPVLRLGVAVSGGGDSMALAYMLSQLQAYDTKAAPPYLDYWKRVQVFAFIADHQLRPNSTEEAYTVKEWLAKKLQIRSEILTLNLPKVVPSLPQNELPIERLAREHRYQALGRACRKHGIDRLLFAHHQDDQAETVLMNFTTGGLSSRLIRPVAMIPECEGMYGVHESGGWPRHVDPRMGLQQHVNMGTYRRSKPFSPAAEIGGVQILRPLLSFSKESLIATLQENDIPWVEDPTNQDPQYTLRNTVRHLLKGTRLPRALQRKSLVALADKALARREDLDLQTIEDLKVCRIEFNSRNGTMLVQFPETLPTKALDDDEHMLLRAALLIRRLMMVVTPGKTMPVNDLYAAAQGIFPSHAQGKDATPDSAFNFFRGQVWIKAMDPLGSWDPKRPVYRFSRQPPAHEFKYASTLPVYPARNQQLSDWTLFDDRFWLRVLNPYEGRMLFVRPFWQMDVALFRSALNEELDRLRGLQKAPLQGISNRDMKLGRGQIGSEIRKQRKTQLHLRQSLMAILEETPRELRSSIPVIIEAGDAQAYKDFRDLEMRKASLGETVSEAAINEKWLGMHEPRVLALPTVDFASPGVREEGLEWQVRYKKIDDISIPLSHEAIRTSAVEKGEKHMRKQKWHSRHQEQKKIRQRPVVDKELI